MLILDSLRIKDTGFYASVGTGAQFYGPFTLEPPLGRSPRCVKHAQDLYRVATHSVRDDVTCSRHH